MECPNHQIFTFKDKKPNVHNNEQKLVFVKPCNIIRQKNELDVYENSW